MAAVRLLAVSSFIGAFFDDILFVGILFVGVLLVAKLPLDVIPFGHFFRNRSSRAVNTLNVAFVDAILERN